MIKKLILITVVLMLAIIPTALADAAPSPEFSDGKYLDIQIEFNSMEAAIGEEFTYDVTITNRTKNEISLAEVYSNFTRFSYETYTLARYESITLEIKGEASEYIDWYAADGAYYTDFTFQIEFYVDGDRNYYEVYDEKVPIKITNLFDGSEYVEIKWLDDRDTFYYYNFYTYDYDEDGKADKCADGAVRYKMSFKNLSDISMSIALLGDVLPGEEIIIHDSFDEWGILEDDDSITHSFSDIFMIDDKYYCYKELRTYKVELIEPPVVYLEINPVEGDSNDKITYEVTISNPSDNAINDFYIELTSSASQERTYYKNVIDLEAGADYKNEHDFSKTDKLYWVKLGYVIDGMAFSWYVDMEQDLEEYVCFKPVAYSEYYQDYFDYDYYLERMEEAEKEAEPTPSATPVITPVPTQDPTAAEEPTATPTITIQKRYNPMEWALMIVALLVIVSAVFVIKAMNRTAKNKEE